MHLSCILYLRHCKVADETENHIYLHMAFSIFFYWRMNDNLLDQLVEHGCGQRVGIAVLPDGFHEAINVVRVVLIGNKRCFIFF